MTSTVLKSDYLQDGKNDIHARQNFMNNGHAASRGESGLSWKHDRLTCSKKCGIALIVAVVLAVVVAVIAVCASLVMLGTNAVHLAQLKSMSDEMEVLRGENAAHRNETLAHVQKSASCEKDLLKLEHQIQVLALQFELEKANITGQLEMQIASSENEKLKYEDALEDCEREKSEVSAKLLDERKIANDKRIELEEKLNACEREKSRLEENLRQQVRDSKAAPSAPPPTARPARPAPVAAKVNYVSRNDGASISPFGVFLTIVLAAIYSVVL